ncbi:Atxe2 family lasso peptide isopeptidase [Sphingobium yanoikuyae]|uniref:Atxe2 family lasso peptide isopeptidase n=1 Tax=Sphingobium yanoikuyae TaxID=13690 RepID=A0A3G2UYM6_SPHYA|nr:Atxe2 family lasso peptide isopeptidase [Sphingobium yanoikuyae]AYO77281.1 Atxe2 family lasso peptide isopeptidase [Sphingobium yanoikuyae]
MQRSRLSLSAALLAAAGALPTGAAALCSTPPTAVEQSAKKGSYVTSEDLTALWDFGDGGSSPANASHIALSPDGKQIALQMRMADAATNSYCLRLLVVDRNGAHAPIVADEGGEFIKATFSNRRLQAFPIGLPMPLTPRWSPSGRLLAYVRRDKGQTRLWLARADGSKAFPLTNGDLPIVDLQWAADGQSVLLETDSARVEADREIEAEGLHGFRYDYRIWQAARALPFPGTALGYTYVRIDITTGNASMAEKGEAAPAFKPLAILAPKGATNVSTSDSRNAVAWTSPERDNEIRSPVRLHVKIGERTISCKSQVCSGELLGSWWSKDDHVLFMRTEGPAERSRLALYRWKAGSGDPVRLFITEHLLFGCQAGGDELLCGYESSLEPRRLVGLSVTDGRLRGIYEPNPTFAAHKFGPTHRMIWQFSGGEAFGDLTLPPDYRPGRKLPLVIVQYISRGFLRGGTGDEYPILPLAAQGFAVLSFQRPADYASHFPAADWSAFSRNNVKGWADRRHVLAALEAAISKLVAQGIVDPDRIGISGLSDGASTVQFALMNSTRFRAAAVSSCCEDVSNYDSVSEEYYLDLVRWGYPPRGIDGRQFWQDYAMLDNPGKVTAPLLMQLSDDEFRMALPAYHALEAAGKTVEMYVFPDEHHIKWQPAHRLAIYRRSMEWFKRWLMPAAPAKAASDDPPPGPTSRRPTASSAG